jgi:hypothetical protein
MPKATYIVLDFVNRQIWLYSAVNSPGSLESHDYVLIPAITVKIVVEAAEEMVINEDS